MYAGMRILIILVIFLLPPIDTYIYIYICISLSLSLSLSLESLRASSNFDELPSKLGAIDSADAWQTRSQIGASSDASRMRHACGL